MIDFDGRCPFCGSYDCEVDDSIAPEWGNNDEGTIEEDWTCRSCRRQFSTHSRVEVVHRELNLFITCPYCGQSEDLEQEDSLTDGLCGYKCVECHRLFWIRPEDYYRGKLE